MKNAGISIGSSPKHELSFKVVKVPSEDLVFLIPKSALLLIQ